MVVTGKGGVGKTAVTAALARVALDAGRRVLAVEIGQARLGPLLDAPEPLGTDPVRLTPKLWAAAIDPEEALGDFVHGVLRLRVFARRLLESTSFQVLAAAAPGLAEFLVLHKIGGWLDARRLGRALYDVVIVDAPASGHSAPLLDAPRTLGALARIEPSVELVQHQELGEPGRRRGQHLERRALEQPAREDPEAKDPVDEVAERLFRVDGGSGELRAEPDRIRPEGAGRTEQRAETRLAELDREHAPARADGGMRQRRSDRALADAALARHHHEPLRNEWQVAGHEGEIAARLGECQREPGGRRTCTRV